MWRWTLVLALSTTEIAAAETVEVQSGHAIADSLSLVPGVHWVAVDGGLARPLAAEDQWQSSGHKLVLVVDSRDDSRRWLAVAVSGETAAQPAARLLVDRQPPSGDWVFDGPVHDAGGVRWMTPGTRVDLDARDPSGVVESRINADVQPPWPPGPLKLVANATDAAGNSGAALEDTIQVDAEGPVIQWQVMDEGWPAAGGGRIYQPPVRLQVTARDAGAGLATLSVDGESVASGADVSLDAEEATIEATDHLGQTSRVQASWQFDGAPPRLEVTYQGEPQVQEKVVRIKPGERLGLRVVDEGVGVADARYRINQQAWRPMTEAVRFVDRGWYQLEIQASDRVGHETVGIWDVRTGNPRAMRPDQRESNDDPE